MKDFMLLTCFVVNSINLIVANQLSDLMKCAFFLLFIVSGFLWLFYSKSGQSLLNYLNNYE